MAEVLSSPSPHDGHSYLSSSSSLLRQSSSQSLFLGPPIQPVSRSPSPSRRGGGYNHELISQPSSSISSSPPEEGSPLVRTSSFHSTPPSSLSLNPIDFAIEDEENFLPTYEGKSFVKDDGQLPPPGTPDELNLNSVPATPDDETETDMSESDPESILNPTSDDIAVKEEPTRQVDYLSHDWREEDIWSSWKHIVSRRKVYGQRSRLENASWRTWAKQKHKLKTVSPETLNWLKDCDVTWLYGPLQEGSWHKHSSEPVSRLSKSNSFSGNKKPILKKRTVSEEMLQKSLSSSSLIKQAAAAVQAQRKSSPRVSPRGPDQLRRTASDFIASTLPSDPITAEQVSCEMPSAASSSVQSPENQERRRIRFDNTVEQCIAVDFKEGSQEGESNPSWSCACSDSEDDDDLPMLKTKPRRRASTPISSRNSFSGESKGIAMLPSTTIKFHHDYNNGRASPAALLPQTWRSGSLATSSSQETLRPSNPSANFLVQDDEDDDEAGLEWQPSSTLGNVRRDSLSGSQRSQDDEGVSQEDNHEASRGLRRTASGMFMPLEEGEEESLASLGILGRVTDTVNTVKDIATVIWNVGWHK